jgi:hypothetical protein
MSIESFEHPFFDVDIEKVTDGYLVKILSVSAHRFTYLVRGNLDANAVAYIRSLLDAAVFGDMVIEHHLGSWEAAESPTRLKKHS